MGKGGGGGGGGRSGGGGFRRGWSRTRGSGTYRGRSVSPTRGSATTARELTPPRATIKVSTTPPNKKSQGEPEKASSPHTSTTGSFTTGTGTATNSSSNTNYRVGGGGTGGGSRGSTGDRCREPDRKLNACLEANPFDRQACQAYVDALAACRRNNPR